MLEKLISAVKTFKLMLFNKEYSELNHMMLEYKKLSEEEKVRYNMSLIEIDELNQNIYELEMQLKEETDPAEDYWNNKYPTAVVKYKCRKSTAQASGMFSVDVRYFFGNENLAELRDVVFPTIKMKSIDEKMLFCQKWVKDNIKYVHDSAQYKLGEYWADSIETLINKKGDCIAEYEEVITNQGQKKVSSLVVGDSVLSYNFKDGKYEYNKVINILDKGILPIKRVHFRNGTTIDITENHPLLSRTSQKENIYEKKYLKDIDLTRWWKRKIPSSIQIPYLPSDIEWLNEDLCFVLGHYLAEGWTEKWHTCTSGYEVYDSITEKLERNNIPFSEGKNGNGVPIIRFLKSDFKEFLKKQKSNSFDIHIDRELLELPINKLEKILDGYFTGDGHNITSKDKRGFTTGMEFVYSTSSEQLARDIQLIHLKLGKPLYYYKQFHHQGEGKEPIYRLSYNPNSHFSKEYYNALGEVSISFIEDIGEEHCYDFEVENNHNFFFKNGILSHNCDDGAILMANLAVTAGVPYWRVRVTAGEVSGGGHAYLTYLPDAELSKPFEEQNWLVCDWCYLPNIKPFSERPNYKDEPNYYTEQVWFSFNKKYAFQKKATAIK